MEAEVRNALLMKKKRHSKHCDLGFVRPAIRYH